MTTRATTILQFCGHLILVVVATVLGGRPAWFVAAGSGVVVGLSVWVMVATRGS